jgi:protein SCO1/2
MKKVLFGLALIATIVVIGCKNENKGVEKSEEIALTEYQCPMKCEDDKTYTDKDVKCPVCGMELKEVEHKTDHSNYND